jgi:hypothetical protein
LDGDSTKEDPLFNLSNYGLFFLGGLKFPGARFFLLSRREAPLVVLYLTSIDYLAPKRPVGDELKVEKSTPPLELVLLSEFFKGAIKLSYSGCETLGSMTGTYIALLIAIKGDFSYSGLASTLSSSKLLI